MGVIPQHKNMATKRLKSKFLIKVYRNLVLFPNTKPDQVFFLFLSQIQCLDHQTLTNAQSNHFLFGINPGDFNRLVLADGKGLGASLNNAYPTGSSPR